MLTPVRGGKVGEPKRPPKQAASLVSTDIGRCGGKPAAITVARWSSPDDFRRS